MESVTQKQILEAMKKEGVRECGDSKKVLCRLFGEKWTDITSECKLEPTDWGNLCICHEPTKSLLFAVTGNAERAKLHGDKDESGITVISCGGSFIFKLEDGKIYRRNG